MTGDRFAVFTGFADNHGDMMDHDDYETLWRARAAEHGITDVAWYICDRDGRLEGYADLHEAQRKTLEYYGEPSCGRGANCADIAPVLGGRQGDYFAAVEALLEGVYDDDDTGHDGSR